jgi:TorA maturation chaperone TorD
MVKVAEPTLLAREAIYRCLASLLADPRGGGPVTPSDDGALEWLQCAAELLREEAGSEARELGFGEAPAERLRFGLLWTYLSDLTPEDHRAEYDRVFGLMSCRECPPYETEFQPNSEPFFRSQQMADIEGFYRAFGLQTPASRSERSDHLTLELEFMALLLMKARLAGEQDRGEQQDVCFQAARSFFTDHLAWWTPSFTRGLRTKAGEGFYAELANVLAAFMTLERIRYSLPAPAAPVQPTADQEADQPADCGSCPARPG